MPDDVETVIYRLVEDAFGLAPEVHVDVSLGGTEDGAVLTVGIDAPSSETLLALRTRVESAGGTVTASGSAGEPTVLRATLPVDRLRPSTPADRRSAP
jgi:hypothetical protein